MVRRRSTAGFRNGAAGGTLVDGVGTFGSVPNPRLAGAGSAAGCVHPFAGGAGLAGPDAWGGSRQWSGEVNHIWRPRRARRAGGAEDLAASRLAAGPGLVVMPPGPCGRPA